MPRRGGSDPTLVVRPDQAGGATRRGPQVPDDARRPLSYAADESEYAPLPGFLRAEEVDQRVRSPELRTGQPAGVLAARDAAEIAGGPSEHEDAGEVGVVVTAPPCPPSVADRATTKIYRIDEEGECREVADTGLPTGKVAWSPDGARIAFAIPRGAIRDGRGTRGSGDDNPDLAGIFVFDRAARDLRRVPGSEDASRLAFPEFVGADSLVYLLSPQETGQRSVFRLVCCIR